MPDLREGVAKPWWRRCLRDESLVLKLSETSVKLLLLPQPTIEVTCRCGQGELSSNVNLSYSLLITAVLF